MVTYSTAQADHFVEPTLEDLLAEPIVRLVMKRDGVNETDMRGQIDRMLSAFRITDTVQ